MFDPIKILSTTTRKTIQSDVKNEGLNFLLKTYSSTFTGIFNQVGGFINESTTKIKGTHIYSDLTTMNSMESIINHYGSFKQLNDSPKVYEMYNYELLNRIAFSHNYLIYPEISKRENQYYFTNPITNREENLLYRMIYNLYIYHVLFKDESMLKYSVFESMIYLTKSPIISRVIQHFGLSSETSQDYVLENKDILNIIDTIIINPCIKDLSSLQKMIAKANVLLNDDTMKKILSIMIDKAQYKMHNTHTDTLFEFNNESISENDVKYLAFINNATSNLIRYAINKYNDTFMTALNTITENNDINNTVFTTLLISFLPFRDSLDMKTNSTNNIDINNKEYVKLPIKDKKYYMAINRQHILYDTQLSTRIDMYYVNESNIIFNAKLKQDIIDSSNNDNLYEIVQFDYKNNKINILDDIKLTSSTSLIIYYSTTNKENQYHDEDHYTNYRNFFLSNKYSRSYKNHLNGKYLSPFANLTKKEILS